MSDSPRTYDYLEGLTRVAKAAEVLDPSWIEILVSHAALERELDRVLEVTLPHGSKVTGSKPTFSFGHKIAVLHATWSKADTGPVDVCDALFQFNQLRNAVAHSNEHSLSASRTKLVNAYRVLNPNSPDSPGITEIAQGICTALGGGPFPDELAKMFGGLETLVKAMSDVMHMRELGKSQE